MEKSKYRKELRTEIDEQVCVSKHHNTICLTLIDYEDCASVHLTLKEAHSVNRYLEDAITTNIMNWEEE